MSSYEAWAVIWPNGRIVAESTFTDADHALRTCLGWPTRGEVKEFLTTGGRVVRVKIEELCRVNSGRRKIICRTSSKACAGGSDEHKG